MKSNLGDAQNAVSLFNEGNYSGQHTSISQSNIAGMKRAVEVSNQIIDDLSRLQSGVKAQADKFPALAAAIESRDRQDAASFEAFKFGAF